MDKIDKYLKSHLDKRREDGGSLQEKEHVCPSEETIACYLDNLLNADDREKVERHLLKCENCLQHTILLHGIKSEAKESGSINTIEPVKTGHGANNRTFPRVSTSLPVEFKYHPGHNGVISGKANILNLSEGGLMMGEVTACHEKSGEDIPDPAIAGEELYDLRFELNGSSSRGTVVEGSGECVRKDRENNKINAGIRFKKIEKDHVERIRDYITKEQSEA